MSSVAAGANAANAQGATGSAPSQPASTPVVATPAPAQPPPEEPAAVPTAPPKTTLPFLGPIKELGPDAYPNYPIRGIDGGSLWGIFPGLQWPYMPETTIGFSGYVWMDSGYVYLPRTGDPRNNPNEKIPVQTGRALLRFNPTWSDGKWFVQGQAELVAQKNQAQPQPYQATADEVWIKVGRWRSFDIQAGRYQAWEVYHFGMGLDLYTLEREGAQDTAFNTLGQGFPAIYGVTTAFYLPAAVGEAALHLYPSDNLRFEVGTQFGEDESSYNDVALRPVGILDLGWMKLKGGAEWKQQKPQKDNSDGGQWNYGAGGSLQFVLDPVAEFGVNYAYGQQIQHSFTDGTRQNNACYSTYSVGGFANVRLADGLLAGAGLNYTYLVNQYFSTKLGRFEDFDQWQGFVAVQYHLFKQVFLKAVGGYALANFNPIETDTTDPIVHTDRMYSGRLRATYLF